MERSQSKVTNDNIDDLLEEWHNSNSQLSIIEYLGLTFKQYGHWVETGILITATE